MTKYLMVCMGNICRSPLAQGILEQKIKEKRLSHIEVDSAGTTSYHQGEPPDYRSVENVKQHGIDLSHLRARLFTTDDFDEFDHIYVMDDYNYNDVISLARSKTDEEKVEMILNVCYPDSDMSVPDPYYDKIDGFEKVYQLLNTACDAIISKIVKNQS